MSPFADLLRDWLGKTALGAERAQCAEPLPVGAAAPPAPWPDEAAAWPDAAREAFLARLGAADDLEADTAPESEAWAVALREARRVAAGLPHTVAHRRGGDVVDDVLAAFGPGVRFIGTVAKDELTRPTAIIPVPENTVPDDLPLPPCSALSAGGDAAAPDAERGGGA